MTDEPKIEYVNTGLTPSGIVRKIYGHDVDQEFIAELVLNCTPFPFGSMDQIEAAVQEVFDATNGSTDINVPIGWATAELDRQWAEYKLTDDYKRNCT